MASGKAENDTNFCNKAVTLGTVCVWLCTVDWGWIHLPSHLFLLTYSKLSGLIPKIICLVKVGMDIKEMLQVSLNLKSESFRKEIPYLIVHIFSFFLGMMLHVDHTKLTVSLWGEENKLQSSMYNVLPTVCICLHMNGIHLVPCCLTEHYGVMEVSQVCVVHMVPQLLSTWYTASARETLCLIALTFN